MAAIRLTKERRAVVNAAIANIKAEAERFDMGTWYSKYTGKERKAQGCSTAACLAGHLALAAGLKPQREFMLRSTAKRQVGHLIDVDTVSTYSIMYGKEQVHVSEIAAHILGFENVYATMPLFNVGNWPDEFKTPYRFLEAQIKHDHMTGLPTVTPDVLRSIRVQMADIAIKRLRRFLKTGN